MKSTKFSSSTGHSGATSLCPIGDSFIYLETSWKTLGNEKVFICFEGTDFFQISKTTLYYNRFSNLTDDSKKSMSEFRTQLLIIDDKWIL